jgi:conjugative relaxase-like TrwC/TraI family protein
MRTVAITRAMTTCIHEAAVAWWSCRRPLASASLGGEIELVLSIGKLDQQMADYYERTVADSREDYYALRGEAPGSWWGRGAESMRLSGEVAKGQLQRLVAFRDPTSPESPLGRETVSADHVGAYDLTFSAPKSVSILYALAPPEVQQHVVAAHDSAVRDALGYLEDHACHGRRGSSRHGTIRQVGGDGFIAALYRHRVSRPVDQPDGTQRVDPQLHTHCIVANRTRSSEDGSWGAIDAKHLYRLATTGGYTYQAALRDALTERLGVDWTPVVNGQADVPLPNLDELVAAYSSRRVQIREAATRQARALLVRSDLMTSAEAERHVDADAAMEMLGTDGMRVATLSTRQAKLGAEGSEQDLRLSWSRQAAELGLSPGDLTAPMNAVTAPAGFVPDATADRVLAELTETVSTFTRHDAVRAMAQHAPLGASRAELDAAAGELLADVGRVRRCGVDRNGDARYTTPEVQEAEQRLVETVRARAGEGSGILTSAHVEAALADRPELLSGNAEQARMVRMLAAGGAGVSVVVGPAGTGKTKALEAYASAARADGRRVVGAAFTGAAAELLEGQTRTTSFTVHKLVGNWRDEQMPAGAVVIVDEAGQLNRKLTGELVALAARDRTKLVLVGDPKQMQPMDSGGPFRAIEEFTPATDRIELTVNRRQSDAAERQRLALVRAGRMAEAVEGYMKNGQVLETPDAAEVRMRMVADWWEAHQSGKDTLLLARRRNDVDLLNQMARQRCVEGGLVSGPAITHQGRTYQAGDELLCLKNDNRRDGIRVRNGMRGHVTEVYPHARRLRVSFRDGTERLIPVNHYPDIAHGWAMTVEKAQGQTVDNAFVLRPAAAGQEWHYTALSRGRDPVKYYLVDRPPDRDVDGTSHAGERADTRSVAEVLAHQWRRSDATELSIDFPDGVGGQSAFQRTGTDPHQADRAPGEVEPTGEPKPTATSWTPDTEENSPSLRRIEPTSAEVVNEREADTTVAGATVPEAEPDDVQRTGVEDPATPGPTSEPAEAATTSGRQEHRSERDVESSDLPEGSNAAADRREETAEHRGSVEADADREAGEAFEAQLEREFRELEAADAVDDRHIADSDDTSLSDAARENGDSRPKTPRATWDDDVPVDELEMDPEVDRHYGDGLER